MRDAEPDDRTRIGNKAANLASLLSAGFPVPDGVVVTTDALAGFIEAHGFEHGTSHQPPHTKLPGSFASTLARSLARFGDVPMAVRSSSVGEDLPEASFAGQYETILDVDGLAELERAVVRCWASAFSNHLSAYRRSRDLPETQLAVLIQPMIASYAAGVAFSANPVTGERGEVVVNAVRGPGERLVSGEVSPEQWVIRGQETTCTASPESAIAREQARAIADLAREVEAHLGTPQDIEWAIDTDGKLHLLQARPITSMPERAVEPIPIEFEVPPGFWQRDPSHNPRAGYHIDLLFFPLIRRATRRWAEEFGYLFEGLEFREFGLWPYMRMIPLGGKERPPPPRWVMWLAARALPTQRRRVKAAKLAVGSNKADRLVERWYGTWHSELAGAIASHRDVDLEPLTDTQLERHIESSQDLLEYGIEVHSVLTGAISIVLYQLANTCEELLGWDLGRALELVSGTSHRSTEPARRLHFLAQMADSRPRVRAALAEGAKPDALHALDSEFAEAFAVYLSVYGSRALGYSVAEPTLSEMPEVFLGMIRGQLEDGYDPKTDEESSGQARQRALHEARSRLTSEQFEAFEATLRRALRAYPVREDNEFFTISAPIALVRYAILELGRRLAERSVIGERDDVRFLELEEAQSALRDPQRLHELVERRKGHREWAKSNPGPDFYGEPPEGPPSLSFLPEDARLPMEALLWSFEEMMAMGSSAGNSSTATLSGIAASAGRYTGPVKVVMDETDFDKLRPGDVLVCPITSPVWSILFPIIGALVTDVGGVLSHPAIIAREYQIPAVVATGEATERFRDGQVITVDGERGTVMEVTK